MLDWDIEPNEPEFECCECNAVGETNVNFEIYDGKCFCLDCYKLYIENAK